MTTLAPDSNATTKLTPLERARLRAEKATLAAEEARKRAIQARNKLQQIESRKNAPSRKAETRRKIIIGGVVLAHFRELLPQIIAKMSAPDQRVFEGAEEQPPKSA